MGLSLAFAPGLYASGQPSLDDLARHAADGVRTIINLRGAAEQIEFDEAREAERLGVRYLHIPIAGPQDVTPENVARFSHALDQARANGGVLIHCASANRVGAMVALDLGLTRGSTSDNALAVGRAAGLASLEPLVQRILAHPAA